MATKASRLKGPPRKARPLTGRGALPSEKNLIRKSPEDLVRTLKRFGIDPDVDAIARRAKRAYERLDRVIAEGGEPDAATWEAFDKQLEREVTQGLRQMTKAAIRNYKQARADEASPKLMWETVGDANVCGSCEPRHGKVKTLAQWKAQGLPGSASLVCAAECRCELLPVEPSKRTKPKR